MDGLRFDAWTRRRFGLAVGGLAGALLGLTGRDAAEAKNRRNRCKNIGQGCTKRKKKPCCKGKGLFCEKDAFGDNRCCRKPGEPCSTATANECCSARCESDECFCKENGQPCDRDGRCCSRNCEGFECAP